MTVISELMRVNESAFIASVVKAHSPSCIQGRVGPGNETKDLRHIHMGYVYHSMLISICVSGGKNSVKNFHGSVRFVLWFLKMSILWP